MMGDIGDTDNVFVAEKVDGQGIARVAPSLGNLHHITPGTEGLVAGSLNEDDLDHFVRVPLLEDEHLNVTSKEPVSCFDLWVYTRLGGGGDCASHITLGHGGRSDLDDGQHEANHVQRQGV